MEGATGDILGRLKFIRGKRTQAEFSKEFDIKANTYAYLEKYGKSLSLDLLYKISKKEKINLNWLITGKGDPYTLPDQIRNQTADKLQPGAIGEDVTPYHSPIRPISPIRPRSPIPLPIVGRVAAGEPVIIYADCSQSETIDATDIIDESFFYRLKYNYSDPCCFVEVSGDSMEPDFIDHDLLLIERDIPVDRIKKNAVGVFSNSDGEWTFKRFNPQGETILLEPLNSRFNTLAVPAEDLRIFGIAIALFRPLH